MLIRDYRDLIAWQKSVDLAEEIYRLTQHFPREERFGITAQLRRSSISVGANIAEGSGRATSPDLLNFLSHSRGSVKETESLILVSHRLDFTTERESARALELTDEVARVIAGLRTSISKKPTRRR